MVEEGKYLYKRRYTNFTILSSLIYLEILSILPGFFLPVDITAIIVKSTSITKKSIMPIAR